MFTKKRAAALAVATATIFGAGVAWAAWTATGTGNGTAKAGTAQGVSAAVATGETIDLLFPQNDGQLSVTLTNPNPYPVHVTSIAKDTTKPITSTSADCDDTSGAPAKATGVTFTTQSVDADDADIILAATGETGAVQTVILDGVSMSNASVNACQGVTFTIPLVTDSVSYAPAS